MNGQAMRFEAVVRRALALLVMCWCGIAEAQVPRVLNYQGFLTNPGGTPVNGAVVMTFRLYGASSGGAALYTEIQPSVNVANGIFNAVIGSVAPFPPALQFDVPYWLTVTINADGEMSPRQQVTASAYAIRSANADTLAPTATVAGAQITGAIVTGTLPTANLTGTIGTAQIADGSVTLAKIGANGCTTYQILKFDGIAWVCASDSTPATVVGFSGGIPSIPASSTAYVYAGPTATIAVAPPNGRLVGVATGSMGTSSGSTFARVDLCYQLDGAGTIINFTGFNWIYHTLTTPPRQNITASASVVVAPGSYVVGYCVYNEGAQAINSNDFMNGWVMATP